MSASPSSTQTAATSESWSLSEIDCSCRVLLTFFLSAAFWLVVSSVFGLIASLKFHSPNFLADCAWLTYGRVHPAATNALLYGFAIQAGLGVALWIIARLGVAKLVQPGLIFVGGKIWNLGVFVGLIGILSGDTTGFENLEMPRYASLMLFIGYLIIGIWGVLTFHHRSERRLQPSQWFLLAALFWFPWIYSTANLLLVEFPVRGVAQSVIAWWFINNLTAVWFPLVGLAVIFYLLPRAKDEQQTNNLALFTFWTLILFASWGGIPSHAPVPAWMPAISTVATALTIIPLLTVVLNLRSREKCSDGPHPPSAKFIGVGILSFFLAGLANIAFAFPQVSDIVHLTWAGVAKSHLAIFGFFGMTIFGAIYLIVPQITGIEWPCRKSVGIHFWCATIGIVFVVVPLAIGGVVQGLKLNDAKIPFMETTHAALMFLRMSTTGEIFIAVGNLFFFGNLMRLAVRCCRTHLLCCSSCEVPDVKIAEVKP